MVDIEHVQIEAMSVTFEILQFLMRSLFDDLDVYGVQADEPPDIHVFLLPIAT